MLNWYKRKMVDPSTSREEYMYCWDIVRDLEQQAAATYQEGLANESKLMTVAEWEGMAGC